MTPTREPRPDLEQPRGDRRRPRRNQDRHRGRRLPAEHPPHQPRVLDRAQRGRGGRGAIEQELREAMEARPHVLAAGLGIPCTIDRERGVAINAVNLDDHRRADPRPDARARRHPGLHRQRRQLRRPRRAPLRRRRKGARNAVLLTIGTGIGGGLIIDGELYRGSTGAGAELGHIVVEEDGPPCQGDLPEPRLRGDDRLRHRARPRGARRPPERDPGLGARQGACRRAGSPAGR